MSEQKMGKSFEYQIQYALRPSASTAELAHMVEQFDTERVHVVAHSTSAAVSRLGCTDDHKLLHDLLDELLDNAMKHQQPQTHDENLQTIFWVRGAGCPVRPHKHLGLTSLNPEE